MTKSAVLNALLLPVVFLAVFWGIAFALFATTGKAFYVFNFGYIGTALAISVALSGILPRDRRGVARRAAQLFIGIYLIVYVGIMGRENLQIEGFWVYLFSGVFAGATIHYLIAKILGTVIFNRGWCGWACWSAMVFDLLPWKEPMIPINRRATYARYAHFTLALAVGSCLFFLGRPGEGPLMDSRAELTAFLVGNLAYYLLGVTLAAALKDNRAFCKYLCPIPVFQKVGSRFSLMKIEIDPKKCVDCGRCERKCPMQVGLLGFKNAIRRVDSTECILCMTCLDSCPKNAISCTMRLRGTRARATPKVVQTRQNDS